MFRGIDEPVYMSKPGGSYYFHYDGLGNVAALSNYAGDIVERYEYDVFGKPTIRNGSGNVISKSDVNNPYMFTGREYDAETGLYYYRARYYHPTIGRFLQPDPIGYAGGLNLYGYCGNNPINFIDPYGLWSFFGWLGGNSSVDFTWGDIGRLGTGFVEGGTRGAAAWADGVIPFADPFKKYYTDSSGNILGVYKFSRAMGHVSRDALLAAAIPNISTWVKNPVLYEIGSKTLPTAEYTELGLEGFSALEKGSIIVKEAGSLGSTLWPKWTIAYLETIRDGGTPGAWLGLIALLEAADCK